MPVYFFPRTTVEVVEYSYCRCSKGSMVRSDSKRKSVERLFTTFIVSKVMNDSVLGILFSFVVFFHNILIYYLFVFMFLPLTLPLFLSDSLDIFATFYYFAQCLASNISTGACLVLFQSFTILHRNLRGDSNEGEKSKWNEYKWRKKSFNFSSQNKLK